jgi:flagellar basal-body rod modification protein FlgD
MSLAPTSLATQAAAQASARGTGGSALTTLSSNFDGFLRMLMTQLQNQDPTSPMDTNEFTRELVQFSSVEQQIATNASLTRLIELTQAGEVMQSSAMIGRQVAVDSETLPLQSGQGLVRFETVAEQPVQVLVLSSQGTTIAEARFAARRGPNDWSWDGKDASGRAMPDGAYRVAVQAIGTDGKPTALPFQVVGVASGVTTDAQGVKLQLGTVSVPFSAVRSVTQ